MANEFVIKHGYFSQGNSNVTGSLRVSGSIGVVGSGSAVLSVYGSQGNLLTAVDTFSGSIFTVSDLSGYPILDITSDYVTGSVYIPMMQSQSQQHVVAYDSASGLLTYMSASGMGGTSINSSNFVVSFAAATTWTVNHNLDNQYVIIQTFDSSYNQIIPQEITLTNANTATVTFAQPEAGFAIVTIGGALLSSTFPAGNSFSVQYNNGGIFGGDDRLTFNGTDFNLYSYSQIYKALSTSNSDYYTYTEIPNYRYLSQGLINNYITGRVRSGEILDPGDYSANEWDLVYLKFDITWDAIDQSDDTKATKMLGIFDPNGETIITEGYITVGESGNASNVPLIDGTLEPGLPVYIKEGATGGVGGVCLSTTIPTTGIVRILGHLIQNDYSDTTYYWLMKFRPDHTWVKIP